MNKGYWKCEFESKNGEIVLRTIYAKTSCGAFQHTFEMGARIGMTPKYETLREATDKEVKGFKNMIKKRISMKKISNKKLQEKCFEDAIKTANEINEAICYDDRDEKFYTESHYRKLCEEIILAYSQEYTEKDWERDKSDSHLKWFYPEIKDS